MILTYVGLILYGDISKLPEDIKKFGGSVLFLGLFLSFMNYIIRFIKWEYYLRRLSIKIPLFISFLIFIGGFCLSITPGKLGEVFRSYLLKEKYNIPISYTAPIVIADRLTDLVSLLIISSIGSFSFNYGYLVQVVTILLILFVVLFIEIKELGNLVLKGIAKVPLFGALLYPLFSNSYDSLRIVGQSKAQILPLLLSLIAWSFECIALYFMVNYGIKCYGFSIDMLKAFFIYSFSTIAGAIALLPGGIGVTEGSITALLITLGNLSKSYAVTVTIAIRIVTLWFAVVLSFGALSLLKLSTRR